MKLEYLRCEVDGIHRLGVQGALVIVADVCCILIEHVLYIVVGCKVPHLVLHCSWVARTHYSVIFPKCVKGFQMMKREKDYMD